MHAFWAETKPQRDAFERPVERALISALFADRLAFAFAAGYQAALCALFPSLGRHTLAALCATEAGGAHPRAIHTRLDGNRVTGKKMWSTGAAFAEQLFVVASIGEHDGRNQLRVARVPAGASGVTLVPTPDLPFVPELPHAELVLENVEAEQLFEGDGYAQYLKPFRTIEDVHVHAALLGYVASLARRFGRDDAVKLDVAALAAATVALAGEDASSPGTHVALAGLISATRRLVERLDLTRVDSAERSRFERDRSLLEVAGKARAKRLERAWEALR